MTAAARPPLYGDRERWALIQADSLRFIALLPEASVDAIVTDPPYGLNFNQQAWDGGALANGRGFQAFTRAWAEQARRVLKPGGYLACFGASRTMHRAVAGIEDAGLGPSRVRRRPGYLAFNLKRSDRKRKRDLPYR